MEKNRNWILIRGLIRGSFHWHHFPELLSNAFPNDKIHLFDLPGNGIRNTETSPISIQELTDDVRFQARQMERIHLIAISLGGMVALDWASKYPQEIESLFVMNTSLGDTGSFYKRLNYMAYPQIAKSFISDPAAREKVILDVTSNNLKIHSEVLDKNISLAKKYPVSRVNFFRQVVAGARTRFNPNLKRAKNIHFFVSQNDGLVHSDNTFNLCEKLDKKPFVHPWAGHDLTLDDPDFMVQNCLALTASRGGRND